MPDEPPGSASGAARVQVDDPGVLADVAVSAAEGTRKAARWMASALGAVPSLAVLGAVVRAPGEAGFDEPRLAAGVLLCAAGAVIGVLGFAWVLTPIALDDDDVTTVSLARLPARTVSSFDELTGRLDTFRRHEGSRAAKAERARRAAVAARDASDRAAARLTVLERVFVSKASGGPGWADVGGALDEAITLAEAADRAERRAELRDAGHQEMTTQIERLERFRRDAYRLVASDEVRRRFGWARRVAVLSVVLVASGVFLLGVAA